jgi:acyl transferase domain-containing protein
VSFIFSHKSEFQRQLSSLLTTEEIIKGVIMTQFKDDDQQQDNICFVYAGQGPQWWKMGRELYSSEPLFREWIDKISRELEKLTDEWKLVQELFEAKDEKTSRINDTNIAQSCIFALQVALTALWLSWGVRPKIIVGHSVGEIAAAYVSGRLTLAEAVRVIFHRSRLQHRNTRQNGLKLSRTLKELKIEFPLLQLTVLLH